MCFFKEEEKRSVIIAAISIICPLAMIACIALLIVGGLRTAAPEGCEVAYDGFCYECKNDYKEALLSTYCKWSSSGYDHDENGTVVLYGANDPVMKSASNKNLCDQTEDHVRFRTVCVPYCPPTTYASLYHDAVRQRRHVHASIALANDGYHSGHN